MARMPALVAALARTDGRDAKELGWIARVTREQGLITTTGRGRGAAEMTARDAANLLLAANVTDAPREALEMVPLVRGFLPRLASEDERSAPGVIGELFRAPDFGTALETAIEGSVEIFMLLVRAHEARFSDQPLLRDAKAMQHLGLAGFTVEIDRFAGPVHARMAIWQRHGTEVLTPWEWVFDGAPALIESGYFARQGAFDRRVRVTIGLKTLVHLCAALHATDETMAEAMAELGIDAEGRGE